MDPMIFALQTSTDDESLILSKTVPLTESYIDPILQCLYNLSKFINQITFVDTIFNRMKDDKNLQALFLNKIFILWPSIPNNRKDKFYYFIEKLYTERFSILDVECHSEIKQFIIRRSLINANNEEIDLVLNSLEFMEDIGLYKCICDGLCEDFAKPKIKKLIDKTKCNFRRKLLGSAYFRKKWS